jgi:copper chaperone CopZ
MKLEKVMSGGAILAAFAASLCCVGPLLFVVLGLGTFSAATMFESARPYLLGVAALSLVFGFYRTYFQHKKDACCTGEACDTKPANGAGRVGLWLSTIAVIAFALSPYYSGAIARRVSANRPPQNSIPLAVEVEAVETTFTVTGMTCSSCETVVEIALERTPGVQRAKVSHAKGEAIVEYDPKTTTPDKLKNAINQTGYKVKP